MWIKILHKVFYIQSKFLMWCCISIKKKALYPRYKAFTVGFTTLLVLGDEYRVHNLGLPNAQFGCSDWVVLQSQVRRHE